jgi:hypothetical protein
MRHTRKILLLIAIVSGMFWVADTIRHWFTANPITSKSQVLFTDNYHLSDIYPESLAVVADTVTLDSESYVMGDAALSGSNQTQVDGVVKGNLNVVSDQFALGQSAQISGDLSAMGDTFIIEGQVDGKVTVIGDSLLIHPKARLSGEIVACVETITDLRPAAAPVQPCQDMTALLTFFEPLQHMGKGFDLSGVALGGGLTGKGLLFSLSASLLLTGLGALAVTVFPRRFSHIQEAIVFNPRSMSALGCMALLLAVGISAGLVTLSASLPALRVVVIVIGLVLGLALVVLMMIGWITLALILGDILLRRVTRSAQPPVIDVIVGSLLLFALLHLLALVPFGGVIGLLIIAVLGCAGLGGTLSTRIGRRPLRRRYFVQG